MGQIGGVDELGCGAAGGWLAGSDGSGKVKAVTRPGARDGSVLHLFWRLLKP